MPYTYEDVGATREDRCPPGFHRLHVRTRIGEGEAVFRRASEALMTWELHRELSGVTLTSDAAKAAPGVDVIVGLGPITAPCRVVWTVEEYRRTAWAYGTLAGHPESGEEAFEITRTGDGTVWLTITAFSRAAKWYTQAGGPATRWLQHAYAQRCGKVLRRLCAPFEPV